MTFWGAIPLPLLCLLVGDSLGSFLLPNGWPAGRGLGRAPIPPTVCLAPRQPGAAPAARGPQTRLRLPLDLSHWEMPGAPAAEPHLLSPLWRPLCPALAHSPGESAETTPPAPPPAQSPLNTLCQPPTTVLMHCLSSMRGSVDEAGSEGLGRSPWEGRARAFCDLGQDTQPCSHP